MIVLDTNVASEMMKSSPEPRVLDWLNGQTASQVFITATSKAEIFYGIDRLPAGRKRDLLRRAANDMFEQQFPERVLPFDEIAAEVFAVIAADRERRGRPMAQFDAQIAAIARVQGAAIATRDVRDFSNCGIELIDPWA
ncbi:MAG TPA: type II toxin-antitoxin system VapC family toxin [Bryobacteraceae bacterium]|jgi:hypothetical protein